MNYQEVSIRDYVLSTMGADVWQQLLWFPATDPWEPDVSLECALAYEEMQLLRKLPQDFGRSLDMIRMWQGLSQEQATILSGLSKGSLSNIINGHTDPELSTVMKLCLALPMSRSIRLALLMRSKYRLRPLANDTEFLYAFLLANMPQSSLEHVQRFLWRIGEKTL